jgi:hypothetical protein
MSSSRYRPFNRKITIALRCVVRLTEDGYVADCIDAGSVGVGDTQQDALKALAESLEALYLTIGKKLKRDAHIEDERLYSSLVTGQPGPGNLDVVAWGVISRVEITPTAAAKRSKLAVRAHAAFEVTELRKAA